MYVQTPKCTSKQGLVKSGKRMYCDLIFSKNDEQFIQWLLDLESKTAELVYQNANEWFQTPMDMSDIENAFHSVVKLNKGGGYSIRCNVKIHTMTKEPVIKVYNQSETALETHNVTKDSNILSILEIQGIKFSSRSFQIDVEIKQIMVMEKDIFDDCLIKPIQATKAASSSLVDTQTTNNESIEKSMDTQILDVQEDTSSLLKDVEVPNDISILEVSNDDPSSSNIKETSVNSHPETDNEENINVSFAKELTDIKEADVTDNIEYFNNDDITNDSDDESYTDSDDENATIEQLTIGEPTQLDDVDTLDENIDPTFIDLPIETQIPESTDTTDLMNNDNLEVMDESNNKVSLTDNSTLDSVDLVNSIVDDLDKPTPIEDAIDTNDALKEIEIDELPSEDDNIALVTPDKGYYELFNKARAEAKIAKQKARDAYLKAKQIKKNYMLDDLSETSEESLENSPRMILDEEALSFAENG